MKLLALTAAIILPLAVVVAGCGDSKKETCQEYFQRVKKKIGEEPARTHYLPQCVRTKALERAVDKGDASVIERSCADVAVNLDPVTDSTLAEACAAVVAERIETPPAADDTNAWCFDMKALAKTFGTDAHTATVHEICRAPTPEETIVQIDEATDRLELVAELCMNARGAAAKQGGDIADEVDGACTANQRADEVHRAAREAATASADTATPQQRSTAFRSCRMAILALGAAEDAAWTTRATTLLLDACYVDLAIAIAKQPRGRNVCGRAAECCPAPLNAVVAMAARYDLLAKNPPLRAALEAEPSCKAMIAKATRAK